MTSRFISNVAGMLLGAFLMLGRGGARYDAMLELSVRRATIARELDPAQEAWPEPRSIGVAR